MQAGAHAAQLTWVGRHKNFDVLGEYLEFGSRPAAGVSPSPLRLPASPPRLCRRWAWRDGRAAASGDHAAARPNLCKTASSTARRVPKLANGSWR